jgi:hypothetical protein
MKTINVKVEKTKHNKFDNDMIVIKSDHKIIKKGCRFDFNFLNLPSLIGYKIIIKN